MMTHISLTMARLATVVDTRMGVVVKMVLALEALHFSTPSLR